MMYFAEKVLKFLNILKYITAASRVQPAELESVVGLDQSQVVANCRMESAVTRIEPPELESAAGWYQP